MSNTKHYPTHPGAEHPPIMTCEIPLEEYESIKRENAELKDEINDLRVDLEGAKATAYAESVDAGMENRKLKRALWLARAERAKERKYRYETWERHEESKVYKDYDMIAIVGRKARTWSKVESKCRDKAKEYK